MQATSQWSAQQWECECDRLAGLGANSHARKQKQGKSYFLQIQLVSSTRSLIDKLHTHICTNKPINLCQQNYFFSVAFVFFSIHLTLSSSSIFCISFFFCFAQLFSSHLFIFDCTYSYIFAIFFVHYQGHFKVVVPSFGDAIWKFPLTSCRDLQHTFVAA